MTAPQPISLNASATGLVERLTLSRWAVLEEQVERAAREGAAVGAGGAIVYQQRLIGIGAVRAFGFSTNAATFCTEPMLSLPSRM